MSPTTQTKLFDPPIRGSNVEKPIQKYFFTLQDLLPLYQVDTSAGSYVESPPPAGLSGATGQSNQNVEISYVKISPDGNSYTLEGVEGGPIVLNTQYAHAKIKSDGTNWWRTA